MDEEVNIKVYFASDHAGFELKERLKEFLLKEGYQIKGFGDFVYDKDDDYPDFIIKAAEAVAKDNAFGIILGGSGQGEAIAANKVKGIRAAVYYGGPLDIVRLSREHNDANILSLGARFLNFEQAKEAVLLWLNTKFSFEERHQRRIKKISEYENKQG